MTTVACVVVGGGPAGLAAASTVARYGVRVVLIDEAAALGGLGHLRMPTGGDRVSASFGAEADRDPTGQARALGVELRLGAVAWGVFDGRTVAVTGPDGTEHLAAEALVLAAGAHDRPVPFPGWTLPGVVGAGGALDLMKRHGVLPGRRVLVAGSGPHVLSVASLLMRGGARVAAVAEASPMRALWRHAPRMLAHLDVAQRLYRQREALAAAGVPLLTGHVIRRALGDAQVSAAELAPCADDCTPLPGPARAFDVDAVVVGYGFVSSQELARVAGCAHVWDAGAHGWVPRRSRELESTVPGVFIAGDGARPRGAASALAEGHLAGLAVAARLGRLGRREYAREASRVRGRLLHLAGLERVMADVFRVGPGLGALPDGATILCRCEDVTHEAAREAVREGATHVDEVKMWTRAGMGRCQGRMCGSAIAALVTRATGCAVADAGVLSTRPPVRPVPLAGLAR